MKLKQRVGDFQVRELLADDVLQPQGSFRVYRVTKRKMTSRDAARVLADEAGVEIGNIGMCGWKDRQGVTIQHMSVERGREVRVESQELKLDPVGFSRSALQSSDSRGNGFEIRVRDLGPQDLRVLRENLAGVRAHGVANYFDDQRFGNLAHGQGWIARELMRGEHEKALKSILAAPSPRDDERRGHFKARMRDAWGDWVACLEVARRFREHHSIFEHLQRSPEDFAGAFEFVSARLRLIHLYAYQSHIWNRAVVARLRETLSVAERVVMLSEEGKLLSWAHEPPTWAQRRELFRLPGVGLDDVAEREEYSAFQEALANERMVPDDFRIDGVPGFQLKGEERLLVLRPQHLRVRPRENDAENRGRFCVTVRFELPRGAYATLVVKRLFATAVGDRPARLVHKAPVKGRRDDRDGGHRGAWRGSDSNAGSRYGDERADNWRDRPERSSNDDRGGRGRGSYDDRGPRGGGERGSGSYGGGQRSSYDDRGGRGRGGYDDRGPRGGGERGSGSYGGGQRSSYDDRGGRGRGGYDDRGPRGGGERGSGSYGGGQRSSYDDRGGRGRDSYDDRGPRSGGERGSGSYGGGQRSSYDDRGGRGRDSYDDRGPRSGGERGSGSYGGGQRSSYDDRGGRGRGSYDDRGPRGGGERGSGSYGGGQRSSYDDRGGRGRDSYGDRGPRSGGERGSGSYGGGQRSSYDDRGPRSGGERGSGSYGGGQRSSYDDHGGRGRGGYGDRDSRERNDRSSQGGRGWSPSGGAGQNKPRPDLSAWRPGRRRPGQAGDKPEASGDRGKGDAGKDEE